MASETERAVIAQLFAKTVDDQELIARLRDAIADDVFGGLRQPLIDLVASTLAEMRENAAQVVKELDSVYPNAPEAFDG